MTSVGGRRVAWAGTRRKPVHGGSKCAIHGALRSRPRLPDTLQPRVRSGRWEELASAGCDGWCPSRHAPGPDPQVKARHAWMLLLSVLLQLRMARLCPVLMRRRGRAGQVGSGRVGPSEVKPSQAKAIQGRPRQGKSTPPRLGSSPAHQPRVYGMAWVGWRDRNAPWMAHFEPPWVRAHCLRGIASHAFERTAASGWAGPRSGVHGGSRGPTHAVPPRTNLKCRFCLGSSSS